MGQAIYRAMRWMHDRCAKVEQYQILDNGGISFVIMVRKWPFLPKNPLDKDTKDSKMLPMGDPFSWMTKPELHATHGNSTSQCGCGCDNTNVYHGLSPANLYPSWAQCVANRVHALRVWTEWDSEGKSESELYCVAHPRSWVSWSLDDVRVIPGVYGRHTPLLKSSELSSWMQDSSGKSVLLQSIHTPQHLLIFHGYHAISLELSANEIVRGLFCPVGNSDVVSGWLETNQWAYLLYTTKMAHDVKHEKNDDGADSKMQPHWKNGSIIRLPISVVDDLYDKCKQDNKGLEEWESEHQETKELFYLIYDREVAIKKAKGLPELPWLPHEELNLGCEWKRCPMFNQREWSDEQEEKNARFR